MEQTLQKAIDHITSFCTKWSFKLNKMQNDVYGFHHSRKAIQLRTHLSNEALYQQHSDSNGNPLFLGIKLDPKLSYSEHLMHISQKTANRVNLIPVK